MAGLDDAVAKAMGADAEPMTEAEARAATDARSVEALAELVPDPFVRGERIRPSLAGVHPANRTAHAIDEAFDAARKSSEPTPGYVFVDGAWQPA